MNKNDKPTPDCILSDNTEVTFDKHRIKWREWIEMFSTEQIDEERLRSLAKFAGLDFDYVYELSMYDVQLLTDTAIKVKNNPVPNLLSESISTS
jgi:hypothetical protein